MSKTLAFTDVFTTLNEVESKFSLSGITDPQFFPEWRENLPELTPAEQQQLDRIKNSYLYNRADGPLLEGTVNLLIVSPLLYLAGFCDPPFRIRGEQSVEIALDDGEEIVKGRIDALILQNHLWLFVIESKRTTFPYLDAIPQALAYMMANPRSDRAVFGLVTNGDSFIFIKLVKQPEPQYNVSAVFSLFAPPNNELYDVLRIMKRFGTLTVPNP